MSGGRFNYYNDYLKSEMFGYGGDKTINVMEDAEISELVWDVLELISAFDYYESCDTDRETYIKAKNDFKNKWFKNSRKIRLEKIVDRKIEELKKDIAEMIGEKNEVIRNRQH